MIILILGTFANAQSVAIEAAKIETRCHTPIAVEFDTNEQADRFPEITSFEGCSSTIIAAALNAAAGRACDFKAEDRGDYVLLGPASRREGVCTRIPTALDQPLNLPPDADYEAFDTAVTALGISHPFAVRFSLLAFEERQPYGPSTTLREVFHPSESRRNSWLPNTDARRKWSYLVTTQGTRCRCIPEPGLSSPETLLIILRYVGGPYRVPYRSYEGPYDHRLQWWKAPGKPRFRSLTTEEGIRRSTIQEEHEAGRITDHKRDQLLLDLRNARLLNAEEVGLFYLDDEKYNRKGKFRPGGPLPGDPPSTKW